MRLSESSCPKQCSRNSIPPISYRNTPKIRESYSWDIFLVFSGYFFDPCHMGNLDVGLVFLAYFGVCGDFCSVAGSCGFSVLVPSFRFLGSRNIQQNHTFGNHLTWAKSRDSYRRIAIESYRRDSNHYRSLAVISPSQNTEFGPRRPCVRCAAIRAIGVRWCSIRSTWTCGIACES